MEGKVPVIKLNAMSFSCTAYLQDADAVRVAVRDGVELLGHPERVLLEPVVEVGVDLRDEVDRLAVAQVAPVLCTATGGGDG